MPPVKAKLPCVCGNQLLQMFSGYGNYTIKCAKCGMEAYGRNNLDVISNWNKKILEERGKKYGTEKV